MKKILATTIALLLTSTAFGWDRLPDGKRISEIELQGPNRIVTKLLDPCVRGSRNIPVSVIQFRGGEKFSVDIVKISVTVYAPQTGELKLLIDGDNKVRKLEAGEFSKPFVLMPGHPDIQFCVKEISIEGDTNSGPTHFHEMVRVIGH